MNSLNDQGGSSPGASSGFSGPFGAHRTTLVVGHGDTGKTLLALQTIASGASRGEAGLFVSFEEDPEQIRNLGAEFGWDLRSLEKGNQLLLFGRVKPRVEDGGQLNLTTLLETLGSAARQMHARYVAFDGLHVLLALLSNGRQVDEMFRLRDWAVENGLTAVLTANVPVLSTPGVSPLGRLSYMEIVADCIVALSNQPAATGEPRRMLRVLNYRSAVFPSQDYPYSIGPNGVEVLGLPGSFTSPQPCSFGNVLPEVEKIRSQLAGKLHALDEFLQVKQAELDFLLQHSQASAEPTPEIMPPQR